MHYLQQQEEVEVEGYYIDLLSDEARVRARGADGGIAYYLTLSVDGDGTVAAVGSTT